MTAPAAEDAPLGVIVFRAEGGQIATDIRQMRIPRLELAQLCTELAHALRAAEPS